MIPTRWLFKAAEAGLYFTSDSLDDTLPDGCLKLAKPAFILPQRRLKMSKANIGKFIMQF